MSRIFKGPAALAWASTVALTAPALLASPAFADASPDTTPPQGAVAGFRSPAANTLTLDVTGRDETQLGSAQASVDGVPVASAPFSCSDPNQPCVYAIARLSVDTTVYADGPHELAVTVSDAAGNVTTVMDWALEVHNAPIVNNPTATLTIGSTGTDSGPGGSGVQSGPSSLTTLKPAAPGTCPSPRLSAALAQKPLRRSKRVPVLLKGKKYKFTGKLTCTSAGKAVAAAKGTKVLVYNVVRGKSVRKGSTALASGGKLSVKLAVPVAKPTTRTIEFRFVGTDKKTTSVKIKVIVAKKAPKKSSGKKKG